jgi:hypothetical protein
MRMAADSRAGPAAVAQARAAWREREREREKGEGDVREGGDMRARRSL